MDMVAPKGAYPKADWITGGLRLSEIANGMVRLRAPFGCKGGTF